MHVFLAVVHWTQTEEIRNPPPQVTNGRYHRLPARCQREERADVVM